MAKQEPEDGDEIVRQINAGLGAREIDLSVQACSKIPTKKLESGKTLLLREQIVAEIFQQANVTQKQAPLVWVRVAEGIMLRKMLKMTTLEEHERWTTVSRRIGNAIGILKRKDRYISVPAEDLAFIIAAVLFRRLQFSDPSSRQAEQFIEFFGTRNAVQWLPVAIAVAKLKPTWRGPFIIEIDEGIRSPKIRHEKSRGGRLMIVTTKSPAVNIYEADMREAIHLMERQFPRSEMRTKTPDLTDHKEEAIDPGRGKAQAELPAPEPAPVADHGEVQQHRELFERYKFLWKGSLQEHGSVSGSLRRLVYQDCTEEQIFYLEETEEDFLAERMG
ncbi:hypothetical protein NW768_011514 [Fusarium equiseti]|uniref:Uncharacterized protein n=1 Tax=Fusarium equiseti TaxID=61235 RepID=A0ABQ8QXC7_FUSEQ|nr:hypothetical protein NW768_011514 [Fusarium equiseti]